MIINTVKGSYVMGIKISAQISISVRSSEMKNALHEYASHKKTTVGHLIEDAWSDLLAVDEPHIKVKRDYTEQVQSGNEIEIDGNNRRLSITVDPKLLEIVDQRITILKLNKQYTTLDRTTFTQEAIRRFIEPLLIDEGYLKQTVFRDKITAIKNLETLRTYKGLNKLDFYNQFLRLDNKSVISYSQYSLVIRSGSGNIHKIIQAVSFNTNIPENIFYIISDEFSQYLNTYAENS